MYTVHCPQISEYSSKSTLVRTVGWKHKLGTSTIKWTRWVVHVHYTCTVIWTVLKLWDCNGQATQYNSALANSTYQKHSAYSGCRRSILIKHVDSTVAGCWGTKELLIVTWTKFMGHRTPEQTNKRPKRTAHYRKTAEDWQDMWRQTKQEKNEKKATPETWTQCHHLMGK